MAIEVVTALNLAREQEMTFNGVFDFSGSRIIPKSGNEIVVVAGATQRTILWLREFDLGEAWEAADDRGRMHVRCGPV